MKWCASTIIIASVLVTGCQRNGGAPSSACDVDDPDCSGTLVCNPTLDGLGLCAEPVQIIGMVTDLADDRPIAGARVQALDINGAAVGSVGVTAEDGMYVLLVPALRDADGKPVDGAVTLQAAASGFQEFPTTIRPALPIELGEAAYDEEEVYRINDTLTTVKLIELQGNVETLGSISGVIQGKRPGGLLMVAEGTGGAYTGFSDEDGNYVIYNVPAGTYTVTGYAAGLQIDTVTVSVETGTPAAADALSVVDRPLNRISGQVQLVNAPGDAVTSVILALESTFDEAAARGTAPPGLRMANVTGAFEIGDVPDGHYVVLAAFENDDLVRDPDQSIGGTSIVRVTVPDPDLGTDLTISEGFKVTGALAVVFPGAAGPQRINDPAPQFEWEDDSSEDGYEIVVFDAFGTEIWRDERSGASGAATVTHTYAGPPLVHGMVYQFRVTSFRERNGGRTAISATEDLEGVFEFVAP